MRTGSINGTNAKRDSKVSFGTRSSRSPQAGGAPFEMAPETAQSRIEVLDYANNDILAASLPRYASEENFE